MVSLAERIIRFSTDAFGLERILRLLQAIVQITLAVPFLSLRLTDWINRLPASEPSERSSGKEISGAVSAPLALADTLGLLGDLRGRLGMTRRVLRLFRFAESFHGAHKLYLSLHSTTAAAGPGSGLEVWLDISSRTFNGMYLLLESATIPDALAVPHLRVFGPELAGVLAFEAQRFWLLALVCSAASGGLKVLSTYARSAVPETGAGFGAAVGEKDDKLEEEKGSGGEASQERLRRRREEQKALAAETQRANAVKRRVLLRKMAADVADITLPGSVVGWVPVDAATVGSAMLLSTLLTGSDFWERCA